MPLSVTRRSVLQQAGAVAAFAGTYGAIQNIARAQTPSGEDYWELVRRQFIFPESAVPMNCANLCPTFQSVADKVASELLELGVDVMVDDRKERPGVKFNDADLMGMPFQVVCGKKAVKNGNVELKVRATGERTEVAIEDVAQLLAQRVKAERA